MSRIIGVSLGPGNPDLITIGALKALQNSSTIFCPGTIGDDGSIKSISYEILKQLPIDLTRVKIYSLPMSKNRDAAKESYTKVVDDILDTQKECACISIVAEGDSGFYSSANYIMELLAMRGKKVEMIAGVPAFIAAGASVGMHVVKQNERLHVIPGDVKMEELREAQRLGWSVVIMKLPLGEDIIKSFLRANKGIKIDYFENVGLHNEYHVSEIERVVERKFNYFSLMVLQFEK